MKQSGELLVLVERTKHIDEVEAIWSRIDEADDWAPFHNKIEAIRRMGEAMQPPA